MNILAKPRLVNVYYAYNKINCRVYNYLINLLLIVHLAAKQKIN